MTHRPLAAALLLSLGLAACSSELTCPAGRVDCGGACTALETDAAHCGACGAPCATGQFCSAGACLAGAPDAAGVQVACGATDEVIPRTATLGPAGPSRGVSPGPTALATLGGVVVSASGYPAATVDYLSADLRVTAPVHRVPLAGSDLQGVAVHQGAVFVANSGVGTLVVLSPGGAVLDEIPVGDTQTGPNPRGLAFVGSSAYVALGGSNDLSGQAVAVVDLAGLPACLAETAPPACGAGGGCASGRHCVDGACRLPCGALARTIDLKAVPGAADAPGAPFPSRALAVGSTVYVTLGNLKFADFGGGFDGWFEPAGSGRLAVIDTAAGDAVSVLDLGASCGNPGGLAVAGERLFVACGSLSFAAAWPPRLQPVSLAGAPALEPALDPSPVVPNGVVICGGVGYVPDMATGAVRRFDVGTGAFEPPVEVCPLSGGQFPFAYVSDLVCAP
ncbi:MAG: hypothetical protein IPO09_04705 [Anaeromyxobacter sp.]|nr:hypothetical protein [Anaeromyxobacter sp.]MBL0275885.1 hypothetical protein [Anaeromyxobacter sp.]